MEYLIRLPKWNHGDNGLFISLQVEKIYKLNYWVTYFTEKNRLVLIFCYKANWKGYRIAYSKICALLVETCDYIC